MTTDGVENTKKKKSWNAFKTPDGDAEMLSAAKYGAVVSGYLGLSYLIQIAFVYWGGKDTFRDVGLTTLISDIVGFILATFLTWRILVRQPLWAAIFVAFWFAIELFMKVAAIINGEQKTNAGWIFILAAITAAAILGVRGSWKLRQARRSALVTQI